MRLFIEERRRDFLTQGMGYVEHIPGYAEVFDAEHFGKGDIVRGEEGGEFGVRLGVELEGTLGGGNLKAGGSLERTRGLVVGEGRGWFDGEGVASTVAS